MLRVVQGEGCVEGREKEPLLHLGSCAEQRDWAVGFGFLLWFAGFKDWDDCGMFP